MDTSYWQQQASQFLIQGQLSEAIALYEQCIEVEPAERSHYWHLGLALLLDGQDLEAQSTWLSVLTEGTPEQIDAWTAELVQVLKSASQKYHQRGDWQTAALIHQQILELDSENLSICEELGTLLLQLEQWQEAADCWQQVLDAYPDHLAATKGLGIARYHQGQLDTAAQYLQAALAIAPDDATLHRYWGMVQEEQGDLQAAIACYQKAINLEPDQPDAYNNLGIAFKAQGNLEAAIGCYRQAIDIDSNFYKAHFNLGIALEAQQDFTGAITYYQQSISLKPELVAAHNALGRVFQLQERFQESADCYQRATELKPDFVEAYANLAVVQQAQGQLQAAIACYQKVVELKPESPEAYCNLGQVLKEQNLIFQAIACYEKALELKPDFPEVLNNLGLIQNGQCYLQEAATNLKKALEIKPDFPTANNNLAHTFLLKGLLAEAEDQQRKALAASPNASYIHSNLLFTLLYNPDNTPEKIFAESCHWTEQQASTLTLPPLFTNSCIPERRLRIGYVSPDFRTHSVAYFIEAILAHHDPTTIETFCYAQVVLPDDTTERLKNFADHWCSTVSMSDDRLAEQIRADGIDILVDLAGHTGNNRLLVFARKPAPVQISYIGYPSTTGLSQMDYRLTDAFADPPAKGDCFYTESLVRLPGCFLCYTPPPVTPKVTPLPAYETGRVTFGSFNNLAKVTPQVVHLWSQILTAIPSAQLLIKNKALRDESVRTRYLELFASHGIEREQIQFAEHKYEPQEHLGYYANVDIGLDTFPYNGTTTTCEALWMGVPVITLAGQSHVGRVGMSLLSAVGLEHLIAITPEDYVAKAITLASHLEQLAQMRSTLRQHVATSSLCDGPTFVRELEDTYRQLWQRWCASQP